MKRRFEIDDYDINLDGSAVVLYGPKSEYARKGYGRDKNRGKLQVEFMVAQLSSMGIPVYIKPYAGNVPDELKGSKSTDDEGTLQQVAAVAMLGAAIIMDNGERPRTT